MAERLERTFNWARVGGAGLIFFLGPYFPNIGIAYLVGLGVFVLGYAAIVYWMMQSKPESFERLTRVMFVLDIGIVSSAMLVFSSDPSWTTWVIGSLIIIAGGFRFGTAGAFTAAGAISLAYVAIAAYRSERFGLVGEPWRLAFHVSVFILAAYMMSGLLRELEHLRAQREKFVRQAVEAAALRQADRIKSEFLAAMSHDFRSPLTVVRGAVELLLGERPGSLTSAQRELAESAERNVRRLEDFTAQLLEMARLEEGQIALDLSKRGLELTQGARGFFSLRLQHLDIGDRRLDRRVRCLDGGHGLVIVGLRLLERSTAVDLPRRQVLLALQLEVGADGARLGGRELRLGLIDRRLLHGDLFGEPLDAGLLHRNLVMRGLDRQPVVAIVDARDDIAGLDLCVVLDGNVGDVARDLG